MFGCSSEMELRLSYETGVLDGMMVVIKLMVNRLLMILLMEIQ